MNHTELEWRSFKDVTDQKVCKVLEFWKEPARKRNPKWRAPGVNQFCEGKWDRWPIESSGWRKPYESALVKAGIVLKPQIGHGWNMSYNYCHHFFDVEIMPESEQMFIKYCKRNNLKYAMSHSWYWLHQEDGENECVNTKRVWIHATSYVPEGGYNHC